MEDAYLLSIRCEYGCNDSDAIVYSQVRIPRRAQTAEEEML